MSCSSYQGLNWKLKDYYPFPSLLQKLLDLGWENWGAFQDGVHAIRVLVWMRHSSMMRQKKLVCYLYKSNGLWECFHLWCSRYAYLRILVFLFLETAIDVQMLFSFFHISHLYISDKIVVRIFDSINRHLLQLLRKTWTPGRGKNRDLQWMTQ